MSSGRPRKIVDDIDLFRWYQQHHNTPAMETRHVDGKKLKNNDGTVAERRASVWFMHQFDPVIIWQALKNVKPDSLRLYHQPNSWDLYRIIRTQIEMLEDDSETSKGGARVSPATKLAILDRLREFHRIGSAMHAEFLQSGLKPRTQRDSVEVPDMSEPLESEEIEDPIILKMNREAAG